MSNTRNPSHAGGLAVAIVCLLIVALASGCGGQGVPSPAAGPGRAAAPITSVAAAVPQTPAAAQAKAGEETVKIGACDGGAVEVPKGLTGQALADSLMDHWKRSHPEADWVAEQKERHALKPPADNSHLLRGAQGKGHSYGNYTEQDIKLWARETEKFVAEGSRIFHDPGQLGSTVSVSCDMCHPHAANTHPETYPKYQVQLGRVALLRDMINWCVENPVRGERLDPDGPVMRALEAYIHSQRKGVPMDYGKH